MSPQAAGNGNDTAQVDHLVVVARDLDEGAAWCEATLGVTPGTGGEHPLMGTHNRLIHIASSAFRTAYLEIIAINPHAAARPATENRRWFDMDDPGLRAHITRNGPSLVHYVAGVPDIGHCVAALATQGIDRGAILQASRQTANGLLQWHISVRPDGARLFDGCLPTLIQWGEVHPTHSMPASGVVLQDLQIYHPQADALSTAYQSIGLAHVNVHAGAPQITARLQTPRGLIEIHS